MTLANQLLGALMWCNVWDKKVRMIELFEISGIAPGSVRFRAAEDALWGLMHSGKVILRPDSTLVLAT